MDQAEIALWRLHTHGLRGARADTPTAVLAKLAASQGQDFLPGKWSLAQRARENATSDEIDAAFNRGEIIRTHVLRPTWHLVNPADLGWLLAATAPRIHQASAYYLRKEGIDTVLMRTSRRVLEKQLSSGPATRNEIASALSDSKIEAAGPRLAYILMYAEIEGWICSGPLRGPVQTYALVEQRIPGFEVPQRDEALNRLAERFFSTRGPATVKDLAVWASLKVTEARAATNAAGLDSTAGADGRTYFHTGDRPETQPLPRVDLVQAYDEIVMSYNESKDVLNALAGGHEPPGGWATFMHAILLDGQLAGHWRYKRGKDNRPAQIETWLLRPFDEDERASVDQAVKRFADFNQTEITWT